MKLLKVGIKDLFLGLLEELFLSDMIEAMFNNDIVYFIMVYLVTIFITDKVVETKLYKRIKNKYNDYTRWI